MPEGPVPPYKDSSHAASAATSPVLNTTSTSETAAAAPTKKAPPSNLVVPPKKPKLSKAERRALQEQQRAIKSGSSGVHASSAHVSSSSTQLPLQNVKAASGKSSPEHGLADRHQTLPSGSSMHTTSTCTEIEADAMLEKTTDDHKKSKEISLLSHLPPYRGTLRYITYALWANLPIESQT